MNDPGVYATNISFLLADYSFESIDALFEFLMIAYGYNTYYNINMISLGGNVVAGLFMNFFGLGVFLIFYRWTVSFINTLYYLIRYGPVESNGDGSFSIGGNWWARVPYYDLSHFTLSDNEFDTTWGAVMY